MRSMRLRRSRRLAAMPTQNFRQILAAVSQHLVDGSAACVVLGVDVGALFEEKLDDLLAVRRVFEWVVQGSPSDIVADVHAVRVLAQQRCAPPVESPPILTASQIRARLKQIFNDVPLTYVVCEAQRRAVEVSVAGVHVGPEFNEQFDGAQSTGASGAMQRRFITRFSVHVNAKFHQQAKAVHTASASAAQMRSRHPHRPGATLDLPPRVHGRTIHIVFE